MFYHRGFCHDVEALHYKVIALCALFCLSTFGPCTMTGTHNPTGYNEYESYQNDLISTPESLIPTLSLENICKRSELFCFPSTLSGFFSDFRSSEANISSFSEVKEMDTNDTSSCKKSLINQKDESVRIKSRYVNDFSSLNVRISHPLLDWGQQYLHFPSLAFLTVENRHIDNVLTIFKPYTTNTQLYPCNYSEIMVNPGQIASICFVFLPKWLGLSSGQIILQTSSGGFVVQAQGFAVESPYAILNPPVRPAGVSLLLQNYGPDPVTVVKISTVGEKAEALRTKYIEGLILFPYSVTQVATVFYSSIPCVNSNCKLVVETNKSDGSKLEISCSDIASNSYAGFGVLNYDDVATRSSNVGVQMPLAIKAREMTKSDDSLLANWKSQGTKTEMSILDDNNLTFPTVDINTHQSKWIRVVNPSNQPVIMQLLLNSGEIINECQESHETPNPYSSHTLLVNTRTNPSKYGFSIPQNALIEAYVHPHEKALLGPIIFHPSNRCSWSTSALIRNNLSGVEWVSLRGSGGSVSIALLDEFDPINTLKLEYFYGQPSFKVLFAKNVGDLPLKVDKIAVSGTKCALDGFVVGGCESFGLQPGESRRLTISYRADLCTETVRRELELVMSGGILVIPMEVNYSKPMLTLCKRSVFLSRLKKFIVAVFSSIILVSMACSCSFSFVIKDGNLSKTSLQHSSDVFLKPEPSEVEAKPENLTVKTGKDKARRRKKKRSSNGLTGGLTGQCEVSSSHSSNSTPSSPLSPLSAFAPKRSSDLSPKVRIKNTFNHASVNAVLPVKDKPSILVKKTVSPFARAPGAERKVAKSSGGDVVIMYNIWDDHLRYSGSSKVGSVMPTIDEGANFGSLFSMSPQELFKTYEAENVSFKQGD